MLKFRSIQNEVLKPLDLTIYQGEFFGLISQNRAETASILQLVHGFTTPTAGDVQFDGRTISKLTPDALVEWRRQVGYVGHGQQLFQQKTLAENIALPLKASGASPRLIEQKVDELLQFIGLSAQKDAYPRQVTPADQLRVAIARALANDTELLLLDHIFTNIAPAEQADIIALLQAVHREQPLTIILAHDDIKPLAACCPRLAIFAAGEMVETGPLFELTFQHEHAATKAIMAPLFQLQLTEQQWQLPGVLVKVALRGSAIGDTLLAEMIRQYDVQVRLLQGNMTPLLQNMVSLFVLQLNGEELQVALAQHFLKQRGAIVEVLQQHDVFAYE